MIQLTDKAINQIKSLLEQESLQGHGLRIGVVGGGCSGLSYKLNFEKGAAESDKIFEIGDVRIFMDGKSHVFVNGMTLDFSDGLNGSGFTFQNPNAKSSCGCGSSFST